MTALTWDGVGERFFETGVDHGVLYQIDPGGEYVDGVAWNGLTAVTESPSGAEPSPQYADNMKYLNLMSAEEFNATIEAFTYPPEFGQNDGSASPIPGVSFGQQRRKLFGFCYRTKVGNDIDGPDHAYKLHLVYGCQAAPSEKANNTINDSPEAATFSWEVSTTPVAVGTILGVTYKPTAHVTIDSREVDPAKLADLEEMLYGTASTDPAMPLPADVYAMMATAVTEVTTQAPTYDSATDTITIPAITGVEYYNGITGDPMSGDVVITEDTLVKARPAAGYKFSAFSDNDWTFDHS